MRMCHSFRGGMLQGRLAIAVVLVAMSVRAATAADLAPVIAEAARADIVLLGEVHDNPTHHDRQALLIAGLAPSAVVWEMLTADQADLLTKETLQTPAELGDLLQWGASGWPDFSMYQPIFEAAMTAGHWGAAVPRAQARAAMTEGVAAYFGEDATVFGLSTPLSDGVQGAREAEQQAAHCGALPDNLLPAMVGIQRLRDATLARAALHAFEAAGGPVVVVTGNGHARRDRGVPVYLQQAAPDLEIFALGQSEAGQVDGVFDMVLDGPVVARPDPCSAFK